jgi:large subunit ribosomal protein L6
VSRIGKKPIQLKEGITVKIDGRQVTVTGPKGTLNLQLDDNLGIEIKNNQIILSNKNDQSRSIRALFGLTRTLIANMIEGVENGFSKVLKIVGTGYRARLEGRKLIFSLGFSHPVELEAPEGIQFEIEGSDTVKILGIDKGLVGQTAAKIRAFYPPEPYKGKGIRYQDEKPRRKPGKAGRAGMTAGGGK